MREALEEGGAKGLLGRCLGTFDNTDRGHRTKVYVLYVSQLADEYEDKRLRQRKWFPVDEAQKLLVKFKPIQAKYLLAMKKSKPEATVNNQDSATGTASAATSTTSPTTAPPNHTAPPLQAASQT